MIPLMYILPTNEVYTPASGIVTKITPSYSHYRHSIQIEFKYNLDEFFYIEIDLSEFDQAAQVSLYGFYNSHKIAVTEETDEYHLIGKKVSVILSKKVILDIVNNAITIDSFQEGTTIEFKVIQDKQEISDRAVLSNFKLQPISVELTINDVNYYYKKGNKKTSYMPTLTSVNGKVVPDTVDGYFNIFNLDGDCEGLSLVIIPPQDFENHYIFRQNEQLKDLELKEDGAVSIAGTDYFYNNGILEFFGLSMSMQYYLVHSRDEEYKTYVFNAARDRNIYSEITLLFPAVQHNSMTIYDLKENLLIKGKVDYFSAVDGETDKLLHCISVSNCRDFFGRKVEKRYEFRYLPERILNADVSKVNSSGEIGSFYVTDLATGDETVEPIDTREIVFGKKGYMSASNNRYVFSIKTASMIKHSQLMQGNTSSFKQLTGGDFLSPLYRFDSVDFIAEELTVKNGTKTEVKSLSSKDALVISTDSSRLDTQDHATDFGGVTFAINPDQITVSGINISNFSDYIMLCRLLEEPTYGITGVRRDTKDLLYSVMFSYKDTDIVAIYNIRKDKVYYINYAKKEVVSSPDDLPYLFSKYISSIDENKIKDFLVYGSIGTFKPSKTANSSFVSMEGNALFSEDVMHEKYLDETNNIMSITSSSKGIIMFDDLSGTDVLEGTYIPRPSSIAILKKSFEKNVSIYRKIATGVYANKNVDIKSIALGAESFTIVMMIEDEEKTATISFDGGSIEYRSGLKHNIVSDDTAFSYMMGATMDTNIQHDKAFQHFGMIVFESAFDVGIAFDVRVVAAMISAQTLGLSGTVSVSYGNRMFMISGEESNSLAIAGNIITIGGTQIDADTPTSQAKALSFDGANGEISTTITGAEYNNALTPWPVEGLEDNGFVSIDEFTIGNSYSIGFDVTKAQYLQFKEN